MAQATKIRVESEIARLGDDWMYIWYWGVSRGGKRGVAGLCRGGGWQQPQRDGLGHSVASSVDLELLVQVLGVFLDGVDGHAQRPGNLVVRPPRLEPLEHLQLAPGERLDHRERLDLLVRRCGRPRRGRGPAGSEQPLEVRRRPTARGVERPLERVAIIGTKRIIARANGVAHRKSTVRLGLSFGP